MTDQKPLIKPKDAEIKDLDGNVIKVRLSRLPALGGREIITQYPTTAFRVTLKDDEKSYFENERIMLKLMKYVEVEVNGEYQRLNTEAKIENFIPDFEALMKLEAAMLDYNTGFFNIGRVSKKLDGFAATIKQLDIQTLIRSLASSLQKNKPPQKN